MERSEQINELATALSKAQGEMGGAKKDSANPFFKSKYADLSSVWEACRVVMSKHGLAIIQSPSAEGQAVTVETMLVHTSGQFIGGRLTVVAKDDSPQAVGSAITYLRRYALQSIVGVAPEDDDGEAAQGRGNGRSAQPAAAPVVPVAPNGYREWRESLVASIVDGRPAMATVWNAARPEYREYMQKHERDEWDAIKQAAADKPPKVTA